jgi:hypothetical protein
MLRDWRQRRLARGLSKLDPSKVRQESQRLHGTLAIRDGTLAYSHDGAEVWSVPVGSISLIGEYTTPGGPFCPDYFFVFVARKPLTTYEAPMYANPAILRDLGATLRSELLPGLNNRTDNASRVIWPPQLAEQPLLEYRPAPRSGFLGRVTDRFAPLIQGFLTPSVCAYLESGSAA